MGSIHRMDIHHNSSNSIIIMDNSSIMGMEGGMRIILQREFVRDYCVAVVWIACFEAI